MKGVVLAGGSGTRLHPSTKVTNKHLLHVYDRPMIYFPIKTLADAGLKDILIISGGENIGDFMKLLGSGKGFEIDGKKDGRKVDLNFTYKIQDKAGGIAEALGLAEGFAGKEKIAVILGDNIFEEDMRPYLQEFEAGNHGSCLFFTEESDPRRFGAAEIKDGKLIDIEEKPEHPKSNLAVTGLYLFTPDVFDIIKTLKPSARGELEITDVCNAYIHTGRADYKIIRSTWTDAGTPESLHRAASLIRDMQLKSTR